MTGYHTFKLGAFMSLITISFTLVHIVLRYLDYVLAAVIVAIISYASPIIYVAYLWALHRISLKILCETLWGILIPTKALFREVFLTDLMSSMAKVISDMVRGILLMIYILGVGVYVFDELTLPSYFSMAVTCIPFFFRLIQCVVIAYTRSEYIQYINALKHIVTMLGIFFSDSVYLWICVVVVNSLFGFVWDLVVDWDLRRTWTWCPMSPNVKSVIVGNRSFCVLMVFDFFCRTCWTIRIVSNETLESYWILLILTFVEILRRSIWSILRIEIQLNVMAEREQRARTDKGKNLAPNDGSQQQQHITLQSIRVDANPSGWNVLRDMSSDPCENKEDSPWDQRKNFEVGSSSGTVREDVKNLETDLDKAEEMNEEELLFHELLQLVTEREKARCDLTGDEENVGVTCDLNANPADIISESEAPLFNSEKHEVVPTNSSDSHSSSPTSFDVQSIIDQLRQEVEEFKVQQLQKTSLLEMRLTELEIQIRQLTEHVKELESQLIPSTASVESLETCSANKSQLIPSTACVESLETCSADTMDMEGFLGNNKLVFLFGGYDGTTWLSNVDCYSPLSDTKKRLGPTNLACSHAAAAALCGDIYIIGGGDGTVWCNTVESYNPQRNEWTSRPSLARKKGCLSGVTLGSKIYAIGGGDGVTCFSDVEMFDPAAGRWIPTQSMLQKRFSSAVAELNGAIYAAGGYDGQGYLNSAERFDPREVISWSSIPSMSTRRGYHSLVAMNEKIYALGGYNGANMVSSVEEFDPRNNTWIARDEMKEARGYATAAVFGESIFVISGLKDGKILTETVECYKEGQGWSVANLKGAGKRCFFSAICM